MKKNLSYIILALTFISLSQSIFAQQYAVTENGKRVILYRDGTWEYLRDSDFPKENTRIEGESGKSADLLIDNDILIVLEDGYLDHFTILTGGLRLYDEMSGKLKKIGRYEIEYDFHTERIKRIGKYGIEYDFHSDKVKKIGPYPIEYDFHTDKISRIGNTHLKYSFFNGKLTEISGDTPNIEITLY